MKRRKKEAKKKVKRRQREKKGLLFSVSPTEFVSEEGEDMVDLHVVASDYLKSLPSDEAVERLEKYIEKAEKDADPRSEIFVLCARWLRRGISEGRSTTVRPTVVDLTEFDGEEGPEDPEGAKRDGGGT